MNWEKFQRNSIWISAEDRKRKAQQRERRKIRRTIARQQKSTDRGFYATYEWRRLRMKVLVKYGARCQCCGRTGAETKIVVDHIRPIRKYPKLKLVESNLQILCDACNHGKGAWNETDWRTHGG